MAQATKIFSKFLTETDLKKRLAIPAKILPALPDFNGSHAVKFQLTYGTRTWPIVCSVRKQGYKKPVFSGGWRNFVICNGLEDKVGYELTLYKAQDDHEPGTFFYTIEVEKPDRPSTAFSPRALSLQNHEVGESDETSGASRIKARNFEQEKEQLAKVDAPHIKEEKATMEVADFAADGPVPFFDPLMSIFGTNMSDNIAHQKTEQTEMKLFGTPMGMGMVQKRLRHACYTTKEESDIKAFDLIEGNSLAYGTQSTGEIYYYKSTAGLNLELILGQGQRTEYAETVNLNLELTLSLPTMDKEVPEFAHSKPW